jgi:hypothetical protein
VQIYTYLLFQLVSLFNILRGIFVYVDSHYEIEDVSSVDADQYETCLCHRYNLDKAIPLFQEVRGLQGGHKSSGMVCMAAEHRWIKTLALWLYL